MRTLYIIGNGFDIAHKLATHYCDFHEWLQTTNHEGARWFSDSICGLTEVDLWRCFEEALGKIMLDKYIGSLKEEYGDTQKEDDWIGQADSAFAGLEYIIAPQYQDLLDAFREWAISLRGEAEGVDPIYQGLKCKDNHFINFNYTDTLELVYGIKSENILYIHGDSTGDTEIIVGHDHNYEDDRNYIDDKLETVFPGDDGTIRDRLIEMLNSSRKKTDEVIRFHRDYFELLRKAKIKRIVVIGHSYGSVDEPYFAEINRVCPNAEWELGWFSCDDYDKAQALKRKHKLHAKIIPTEAYYDSYIIRLIKMALGKYPKYEEKKMKESKRKKKSPCEKKHRK